MVQQLSPLDAHRFGHGQYEAIALRCADEGQGKPRISARRFDDSCALIYKPLSLRRLYHGDADAILDASQGVLKFQFHIYVGPRFTCNAIQSHQRCLSHDPGNIRQYV